jgi:hypothetical protein
MVDKNLDALIEDVVHGALEDYVEKMSSRLTQYLLDGVDNPDMLSTLAARAKSDAMAIFVKYKGRISKETREAFLEAVEGYEVEVEQTLEKLHTKRQLTKQGALEFAQAARGISEIVNRQNIALANTMATTWYTIAANAVVRKELGDSRRSIMEDAVRTLSDAGIETIDYKSGVKTTIDAAVRRHIVSQVSQAKAQILSDRCDQYDQDLVFVSAHFGARPSHAIWQGKVYSRSGTSDKYPSLDEGTGYSGTGPFGSLGDRLCGVNCQHEMVPYMPGLSQLPDLSFEKEQKLYGMTSEEYYKATQKQRALERKVRKYKRRIALGQEQGLDMVDDRYKLGRTQALLREHCRANGLTRLYERERAYGVKKQPRGLGRIDFKNTRPTRRSYDYGTDDGYRGSSHYNNFGTSKEICDEVKKRYGCFVDGQLENVSVEPLRRFMNGLEAAVAKYPQIIGSINKITIKDLGNLTIAEVNGSGTLSISPIKLSTRSKAYACMEHHSQHEAGHLLELAFANNDEFVFLSGKKSEKILTEAAKRLMAYRESQGLSNRYKRASATAQSEVEKVSRYPYEESRKYADKKEQKAAFNSEGFAEIFDKIVSEKYEENSFTSFVKEELEEELKK